MNLKKIFVFMMVLVAVTFIISVVSGFAQQVDTAWVRRYNGPGNGDDEAIAIALDDSGNVYVTGTSFTGGGIGYSIATIKYHPNGDTAWVRRYPAPINIGGEDIAVDAVGNVCIIGTTWNIYGDYLTIKYNSNGDASWVRTWNGPGNWDDQANALAIDVLSNVYVTGYTSFYGSFGYNYDTIKYDSLGNSLWGPLGAGYNGPGDNEDVPLAIAVDDSGNAYITGSSYGEGTDKDYATIKYHPLGDTAWVRRYNGPGNNNDVAYAIAVDHSGNVYVTGYSWVQYPPVTGYDYTTIKYYPNGDTAWVRTYNGPVNSWDEAHAVAVDNSGNVYVTGYSIGSAGYYDYLTIKYYPDGDTAWVRRYDGPEHLSDYASALAIDRYGNVYVCGDANGHYVTLKYDSNGNLLWTTRYEEGKPTWLINRTLTLDDSGNVYITGHTTINGVDYVTIKYWQNYFPVVTAPDSSFLCGPDTIRFTVWATDPDAGDSLTLSGPGIPTPVMGVSPLFANVKVYIASPATYNFIYVATDEHNASDSDTATWVITTNNLPSLTVPDSSALLNVPDTIRFKVTATDPDAGDTLNLSGPGIPVPITGAPPLSADVRIYVDSAGTYNYVYSVTDRCSFSDSDTSTWSIIAGLRGDANGDGVINVTDVVYLINYLFLVPPGPAPVPLEAGDANCDGVINITDVVYLINFLFLVPPGPPPGC